MTMSGDPEFCLPMGLISHISVSMATKCDKIAFLP